MQTALPATLMIALLLGGGPPPPSGLSAAPAALLSTSAMSDERCAATPYQVLGQAWRSDFSTGGVMPDATRLPAGTYRPPDLAAIFHGLGPVPEASHKAAVIVLDRFEPTAVTVNNDAPELRSAASRPLLLEVRHGALVAQHLGALLESDGFAAPRSQPDPTGELGRLTFTRGAQTVAVIAFDVATSEALRRPTAERLTELVETLATTGYSTIVVNLSFVLMSCRVRNYIEARARPSVESRSGQLAKLPVRYTFESFLNESGGSKSAKERERILSAVFDTSVSNPLLSALISAQVRFHRPTEGKYFVTVGAAGNYGSVPILMPGALTSLISVGATGWDGQPPGLTGEPRWSNRGDVSAVGEWFTLPRAALSGLCTSQTPDPWCVAPSTALNDWPQFAYRGTSFSAPSVTALLASRLGPSTPEKCLPPAAGLSGQPVRTAGCF